MRPVVYTDGKGYMHRVLVKDGDDDSMAEYGIPAGPPDIDRLDWNQIKREINNALVKHNLGTWMDVQRSTVGMSVVMNIIKRHMIMLYKIEYNESKLAKQNK